MKESDMIGMMLGPIVDDLGIARAMAAMEMAKPVLDAFTALVNGANSKPPQQRLAVMDSVRVLELWCKGIREIADSGDNEFPDTIGG